MNYQQLREKLYQIIFGTDTPLGQRFDIFLIYAILISVLAVILTTVDALNSRYSTTFFVIEWFFTGLFTIEYALRIFCSPNRPKYLFSFYGIIDLVSIIPSYLALMITGAHYLMIIRLVRVLRIFRVLKLVRYLSEADVLMRSLHQARRKIFVFFSAVLVLSTLFGCLMYVVEGPDNGFSSIPISIYWTIVTITTVGYGDITPHTVIGQLISTLAMLTGYSIIAIPTGIITAELANEIQREKSLYPCPNCVKAGHDRDAIHCKWCGASLGTLEERHPPTKEL
ncbi:ion transporter [Porticoccus litoralis]|uniref:Ion transporter n=1 Tax=Porticoccus litoralis TaxID=434086 RepID=A0AAW8B0Z1_9GAMM|nr:ion transporter [Porticoccus litoralis]MDP1519691.1 ion transporter [Porticoccus litoralis]